MLEQFLLTYLDARTGENTDGEKPVNQPSERISASPALARQRYGVAVCIVGIALNVGLCIFKGLIGLAAGSLSICADALNNLTDAISNIVAILGFQLAAKPADKGHPYGHGRYEYVSALIVAVLVAVLGFELLRSAVEKIISPTLTNYSIVTYVVLAVSVAIKFWMANFNKSAGQRIQSESLYAAAIDAKNDGIATAAVLVCAVLSTMSPFNYDGWVSFGVALYIMYSAYELIVTTIDPLLGRAPSDEFIAHIHATITKHPEVLATHDLMVHNYGPGRLFMSAHIEMPAEMDSLAAHAVLDAIEQEFFAEGISCILHYDPIVTDVSHTATLHSWLAWRIRSIDPRLTIHDVRCTHTHSHHHIDLDCVRPDTLPMSDQELREAICTIIRTRYDDAVCNITIDHDFLEIDTQK